MSNLAAGVRVLVAKTAAGEIDKDQYTISSTTTSTIVATTALDADTPTAGTARIGDTRYAYTGWSGSTLTGVSPDPSGVTGGFYIPLIDGEATGATMASGTMIYSSDFSVVGRARMYSKLPFENTGTVTDAGLTISAILTDDGIVS
jgi:hypothetical protein